MTNASLRRCMRCDQMTKGWLCNACMADELDDRDDDRDDDCEPEGPAFECAGYYPEPAGEFYCPLWGSEDCDWECPYGGMA